VISDELNELTAKQKRSVTVTVLEVTKLEEHFSNAGRHPGQPLVKIHKWRRSKSIFQLYNYF
jgi:hypothetical protein